jgi:hypothetical protein
MHVNNSKFTVTIQSYYDNTIYKKIVLSFFIGKKNAILILKLQEKNLFAIVKKICLHL